MLDISRRHAEFTDESGRLTITDVGSKHGTTINRHPVPVDRPSQVTLGDMVGFGGTLATVIERYRPGG